MKALFKQETQSGLGFPLPLTEKYRPQTIDGFIGLDRPKAVFNGLLRAPRPCSLMLTGPPGAGKTTMALAFARQLRAGLIHHSSAKMTVDAVAETIERTQYYPETGPWWVVLVDEAEKMSNQAQVALLSPMDSTAALRLKFGGGYERAHCRKHLDFDASCNDCAELIPKIVWIFTCNGAGKNQTDPPEQFEKRFLSRCRPVPFDTSTLNGDLSAFLARVWKAETTTTPPDLDAIGHGAAGSVREALQSLEMELMVCGVQLPPAPEPDSEPSHRVRRPRPPARKSTPPPAANFGSMFAWAAKGAN